MDALVHEAREDLAIHGERRAARHTRLVGARQQETAEGTQLGLEQAVRVTGVRRFERVAADELGEPVGLVRGRPHQRTHLVQRDLDAALRERPGGLRAGETAADYRSLHASAASSGSVTMMRLPHFMQVRVSPSARVFFCSMPTHPHSGHVSATGLFQVEKSQAG